MNYKYNIGGVYRRDGYSLTIINVTISAGYHYDHIKYDVETYYVADGRTSKFKNISEGAIGEVIDTHHLRLAGDIRPIKKIKKLQIQ